LIGLNESEDLFKACQKAQDADGAEGDLVSHHKSPALDAALQSESSFWKFLIDPSRSYMDRMAAMHQGGSRVSPEQLPRLWKVYAVFEVLPSAVNPSPCEFITNAWPARSPSVWARRKEVAVPKTVSPKPESRTLLGFEIRLPEKAIDYRLDVDRRNNSARSGKLGGRLLALDEASGAVAPNAFGGDSLHLEELMHVAHIAILRQTSNPEVATESSFQLAEMAKRRPDMSAFAWKRLQTATSILAITRWAMNRDLAVHSRY
jgi:hypothetical protein